VSPLCLPRSPVYHWALSLLASEQNLRHRTTQSERPCCRRQPARLFPSCLRHARSVLVNSSRSGPLLCPFEDAGKLRSRLHHSVRDWGRTPSPPTCLLPIIHGSSAYSIGLVRRPVLCQPAATLPHSAFRPQQVWYGFDPCTHCHPPLFSF
jgi:hypothetical protein